MAKPMRSAIHGGKPRRESITVLSTATATSWGWLMEVWFPVHAPIMLIALVVELSTICNDHPMARKIVCFTIPTTIKTETACSVTISTCGVDR
eukprot:1671318-Amphidinium_carterae.1